MTAYSEIFNKDCEVRSDLPNSNQGTGDLGVAYDDSGGKGNEVTYRSYAYVDISDLGIVAANVDSAYAHMFCSLLNDQPLFTTRWFRALADWDEYTLTWNNQPGADSLAYSNIVHPVIDWNEWTITDGIKDALTNRSGIWNAVITHVGFTTGYTNAAYFCPRDNPYEPNRAHIHVNYTVGGVAMKARIISF